MGFGIIRFWLGGASGMPPNLCGHFIPEEKPEELTERMLAFFACAGVSSPLEIGCATPRCWL
jgi:hypothetical protein